MADNDLENEEDETFDFGKAKLDYFKTRAREILMNDKEQEYEGAPVQLTMCYKTLKNALRNPVVVHNNGSEHKPGYLKMTFSMCRNAVNGDRFLEISKLKETSKMMSESSSKQHNSYLPPLMRAGKESQMEDSEMAKAMLGSSVVKKKSKKEEQIDKKIEYLLETYKKQDEEAQRKAREKEQSKSLSKKLLRDKFGFNDEDDDEGELKLDKKIMKGMPSYSANPI